MFDNKEIAKRALAVAEELRKEKRRLYFQAARKAAYVCAVASAFVIIIALGPADFLMSTLAPGSGDIFSDGEELFIIIDNEIPLAGMLWAQECTPIAAIEIPEYVGVAGDTAALRLYNPEGSPYHFTFEIILADSRGSIYASGLIAPSESAGEVKLSAALEKNNYKAVLIIRAYDESLEIAGSEEIAFNLVVE